MRGKRNIISLLEQLKFEKVKGKALAHEKVSELLKVLECEHGNNSNKCECSDKASKPNDKMETMEQKNTFRTTGSKTKEKKASEEEEDLSEEDNGAKNGKLKSGKCTRPDEVDIKRVVKFPHEKLNSRHTQVKAFEKLDLNLLIAGELEIALLDCISQKERMARLGMAKTICYHRLYLEEEDLRNGYEDIMRKVEQGKLDWGNNLAEKLHEHYVFRANVNLRARLDNDSFTEVSRRRTDKSESKASSNDNDKIIYCQEFNKKLCIHNDHHEGRFMNKKVTKWHLCSKCIKSGEKKSHPGVECPKNRS